MPKKTTAVIVNSNNEYLIGVKGNQPKLYKRVTEIFSDRDNWSSSYGTIEVNKGRTESRYIMVSNIIEGISKEWKGLQQIVAVNRRVKDKGKISEETAYFISSKDSNAFFYAEGTRNHWSIENSLHWVKDVTLKEDASKITKGNAPQNMSTIKNIGINLLRKNNFTSIAQGIRLVANDIKKLFKMIK